MSDGPKIEVIDEPGAGRFVVQVDGTLAGSAYYQRRGDRVVFTHTEIDDVFEGRGVGSALTHAALANVRANDDLVDRDMLAELS